MPRFWAAAGLAAESARPAATSQGARAPRRRSRARPLRFVGFEVGGAAPEAPGSDLAREWDLDRAGLRPSERRGRPSRSEVPHSDPAFALPQSTPGPRRPPVRAQARGARAWQGRLRAQHPARATGADRGSQDRSFWVLKMLVRRQRTVQSRIPDKGYPVPSSKLRVDVCGAAARQPSGWR